LKLAAEFTMHFKKLKVTDVRRETADCVSVAFAIPVELREEYRWRQGQNITIRYHIGKEDIRRSYSICSSPFENELRIAIKKVPGGLFSPWANEKLITGEELEVLPPSGRFYTELDPSHRKHYLAFAAGSGITPILSLIKTTLAVEPESQFTLIYGNRSRQSIIFREELEGLKNRYMRRLALHHVLSREKVEIPLNQGRIDVAKCSELCGKIIDLAHTDEVFICGPADMIFSVRDWLQQQGTDPKKIHFELFQTRETLERGRPGGSGVMDAGVKGSRGFGTGEKSAQYQGKVSKMTVKLDGISYDFDLPYDAEPILDAALYQGADLPFACKGGVCCTCRARLTEGKVEMEVNYALEEDELAKGYILTCQSHPRTERVIVDFDAK
jgi:ring-1,2-phenylacetyl-CoA epoxidase subunit PaaE